jgi:hypothetical protein
LCELLASADEPPIFSRSFAFIRGLLNFLYLRISAFICGWIFVS